MVYTGIEFAVRMVFCLIADLLMHLEITPLLLLINVVITVCFMVAGHARSARS